MSPKLLNKKEGVKIRLLFLNLVLLFSLYYLGASPTVFLVTAGIIAVILYGWIIYREFMDSEVKITPILVLFVVPFLMMGIAAVYHGFLYIKQTYVPIGTQTTTSYSIVIGYLMVSTGLLFQYLGMIYFRRKTYLTTRDIESGGNVQLAFYFVFFLILAREMEINFKFGVLQSMLNLIPLAILIYTAVKDKSNKLISYQYKRNLIIFGSLSLFITSLATLSKTSMVFAILPIPTFYLVHSQSKKYKIGLIGGLVMVIYLMFIQPLVANGRLALSQKFQDVSVKDLSNYILSGNYAYRGYIDVQTYNKNPIEITLNRLFEINAPAYIYDKTEVSGFRYGETFNSMAYALIPRILWPSKPNVTQGDKFSIDYFNQENNNIGMLIAGELYWNFGYPGIIIGSLILGLTVGFLWKLIAPYAFKNFLYFTIYFYLLQSCFGGSEFSAVFLGILQLLVIFSIIRFTDKSLNPEKLKLNLRTS